MEVYSRQQIVQVTGTDRHPASLATLQSHMVVQDFFVIQGLDTLWEAFLRSSNSSVVKDAGEFITQLHLCLREPSDRTSDVWGR